MKFDVCYIISQAFSSRMILHSGLLPVLRNEGLRVALVTPNAKEKSIRALADRDGVALFQSPSLNAHFQSEYERLRRYALDDIKRTPALWAKHLRDLNAPANRVWRRAQARVYFYLNQQCQKRPPPLKAAFRRLEGLIYSSRKAATLLADIQPTLLLATYPVAPIEAIFLREAKRKGITTIGQLLSWDNITCKGHFSVIPDHFLAWGPIMVGELREQYGVSPDRISECGVAHFGKHVAKTDPGLGRAVLEKLGLDALKPYLFFGMSSPYFSPREINIVEWLAGAVNADTFGRDMQLIVRPHPQNVQGNMADPSWLPRLEALNDERVVIDFPLLEASGLMWNMSPRDLPRLVALLAGSSVTLNSGSTFTLDALLHDKPVVLTAFDAEDALPWWLSARRLMEYPHLATLIALGGVSAVTSFQGLEKAILAYLAAPELHRPARAETREKECGPWDGRASERAAAAISHLARVATVN